MNKWQIICPLTLLVLIGVLAMRSNEEEENRILTSAIDRELDNRSPNIATLLETMHTNDAAKVEDAIYQDLQRSFPAGLITRSEIHVTRAANGVLECTFDTVPPRTVR